MLPEPKIVHPIYDPELGIIINIIMIQDNDDT